MAECDDRHLRPPGENTPGSPPVQRVRDCKEVGSPPPGGATPAAGNRYTSKQQR